MHRKFTSFAWHFINENDQKFHAMHYPRTIVIHCRNTLTETRCQCILNGFWEGITVFPLYKNILKSIFK